MDQVLGKDRMRAVFYCDVENTTIAVAYTLFILTWNTRNYWTNNYIKLLGIGYAFTALVDLLHMPAYKGMGIFDHYGANLPTQLWIMLDNLIANAMKCTRSRQQATIEIASQSGQPGETVIFVRDNGVGVRHDLRGQAVRRVPAPASRR
jgi:signal transduction histidine kinase